MKHTLIIALTSLSIILAGCGATKNVEQEQKESNQRNQFFMSSKNSVEQLTDRFKQVKQDNLSYYAKDLYKDALDEMEEVNEAFDDIRFSPQDTDSDKVAEIKSYALKTNSLLDQAYLVKQSVDTTLAETFAQVERLKTHDIERLYPNTFAKYSKQIDGMVKDIADGDVKDAQAEQAKLLPLLYALEGKVVKHIKLSNLERDLAALKKSRVERVAPISYQKAVVSLQSAESIIIADPRAMDVIDEAVEQAKLEISHIKHIVLEIKSLAAVKTKTREAYVLQQENKINEVAKALNAPDLRSYSINEQYDKLVQYSADITSENLQNQEKLKTLSNQLSTKEQLISSSTQDSKAVMQKLDEKLVYIGTLEQQLVTTKLAHQQALTNKENELLQLKNTLSQLQLSTIKNPAPTTLPESPVEQVPTTSVEKPAVQEGVLNTESEVEVVETEKSTVPEEIISAEVVEQTSAVEETEPAEASTTTE